ncbi:hypothetical protein FACS189483_00230 [Spirochaetia bacterium]|nr:hypothetical protein FACS189483_00230 [Spirochaetia bacterium]
MKKHSVLWLLPLAAALLFGCASAPSTGAANPPAAESSTTPSASPDVTTPDIAQPPLTDIVGDPALVVPVDPAPVVVTVPAVDPAPAPVLNEPLIGEIPGANPAPGNPPATVSNISRDPQIVGTQHSVPLDRNAVNEGTEWSSDGSVPSWVLNPDDQENGFVGIGSARSATTQLSIQMAEARARQDIAFQLSAQVEAIITDYANNVGSKEEFDLLQASKTEMVGRQLANITLTGVKVTKRARTSDNTWWVEVTWSREQARRVLVDSALIIAQEAARKAEEEAAQKEAELDALRGGSLTGTSSNSPAAIAARAADVERAAQEAARLMDEYLAKAGLKSSVE